MAVITRLELQRRRRDRVSVFLDGDYAFSLALDLAAALHQGQALDEAEVRALRHEDATHLALGQALGFLGYRPRSRAEVARYLASKDTPPEVVERVLGRLAALELLDDAAFAAWWVENRSQHRPRGRHALMQELSERGIAREVITAALAGLDEAVLALRVARRLAPRYSHLERPVFRRRLGALLQRRGFGQEAVYRAVEAAWQGREAPE